MGVGAARHSGRCGPGAGPGRRGGRRPRTRGACTPARARATAASSAPRRAGPRPSPVGRSRRGCRPGGGRRLGDPPHLDEAADAVVAVDHQVPGGELEDEPGAPSPAPRPPGGPPGPRSNSARRAPRASGEPRRLTTPKSSWSLKTASPSWGARKPAGRLAGGDQERPGRRRQGGGVGVVDGDRLQPGVAGQLLHPPLLAGDHDAAPALRPAPGRAPRRTRPSDRRTARRRASRGRRRPRRPRPRRAPGPRRGRGGRRGRSALEQAAAGAGGQLTPRLLLVAQPLDLLEVPQRARAGRARHPRRPAPAPPPRGGRRGSPPR